MMCFDTGGVSSLLDGLSFLAWENGHKLFFTEFLHFRQVHKGFDQIEFWTRHSHFYHHHLVEALAIMMTDRELLVIDMKR